MSLLNIIYMSEHAFTQRYCRDYNKALELGMERYRPRLFETRDGKLGYTMFFPYIGVWEVNAIGTPGCEHLIDR